MRRRLDTSELAFYEASRSVVTNCVIAVHLRGDLDPAPLRRAIDRVQARHPLLRVRVEPGEIPRLVDDGVPEIPLAIVPRPDRQAWIAQVGHELNTPAAFATGPLCRFAQVRGADASELILTFSHMIGDGFSGAAIVRDLMAALRAPQRPLAPMPARPPLAEQLSALGVRLPGVGLLGHALDLAADSLALVSHHLGGGASGSPRASAGARHEASSWTFDEAWTAAALARCRAAKTTVYGMLGATLLTQVARAQGRRVRLALSTPINIRPMFDPPIDDDVGVYAYAPTLPFAVGPDEPRWPLARDIAGKVQWARRLFIPRAAGLTMRAMRPFVGGMLGAPRPGRFVAADLVASNVGQIPAFAAPEGLQVTHTSMFAMIPGVDLVMVSQSYAGRMILNFVHTDPSPRPGLAAAARDGVLAALRRDGAAPADARPLAPAES